MVAFILNTKTLGTRIKVRTDLTNRFVFTTLLVHAESSPKNFSTCWAENDSFDLHLLSLAILYHFSSGEVVIVAWAILGAYSASLTPLLCLAHGAVQRTTKQGGNNKSGHVAKLTRFLYCHCLSAFKWTNSSFSLSLVLSRHLVVCLNVRCFWIPTHVNIQRRPCHARPQQLHVNRAYTYTYVTGFSLYSPVAMSQHAGTRTVTSVVIFPVSKCSRTYTVR